MVMVALRWGFVVAAAPVVVAAALVVVAAALVVAMKRRNQ